jgi:hypothetical protein
MAEEKEAMKPINLPQMVKCSAGMIANYAFQPATDPALTVQLQTQDGQIYLLPLSEPAISLLWEVVSNWRQARDFLSQSKPSGPTTLQ